MCFLFMSHNRTFITRFLYFHISAWEQNYRAPGIDINNHHINVLKPIKTISNSKNRANRKYRKHKTLVFQKNTYKMQTYKNPFEQNNDYRRSIHETQFRSSLILLFRSIKLFTRLEHPITSQKMTLARFSSFFNSPIFKRSISCYFNVLLLNFTSQNVLNLFLFFS